MPRTINAWPVAVAISFLVAGPGRGQSTWTGAVSTDWNTAGNWSPAGVPNSATATVNFTANGSGTVNISSSVQAKSLTYNQPSGTYFLQSNPNLTLSGVTAINIVSPSEQLTISPTNLFFPTGSNLTITNNIANGGLYLQSVIGTPGTGGVVATGAGYTNISGSFASGGNAVAGGLTHFGPGTLDFSGSGATLGGGLTLNGGFLELDYFTNTASKLAVGGLTLNGGGLGFYPNGTTAVTQPIQAGTSVAAGHTTVQILNSGAAALTLAAGAINRSFGATADFNPSTGSSTFTITTTTGTFNGLLGSGPAAYATVDNGATWATEVNGNVSGVFAYSPNAYTAGANTDVTASASPAAFTTNSLRFNVANLTLGLTGTNTLQSGGILVTGNGGNTQITGASATLTAQGGGELLIHAYNSLTIAANIASTAGLTKTGPSPLVLSGNNTGLTGPININVGDLTVSGSAAPVNSASAINFDNDSQTIQQFTVSLPNNTNATINPPIRLSAFSAPGLGEGTFFTTSPGCRVTLAGVISSAPGLTTPIQFNGNLADTSGFNLTNANTFTGDVTVANGTLGINSDASLGNPANTLFLQVGDASNGGLELLQPGTITRPVVFNNTTRIVTDSSQGNIISSALTGNGALVKDGPGPLTLTGNNSGFLGQVFVNGGTLVLGHPNALGSSPNGWSVGFGSTLGGGTLDLGGQAVTGAGPGIVIIGNGVGGNGALINSSATPASFAGLINDNISPGGISFTVGGPGDITLNGSINKNTTLTKIGSGTLTLSGTTDNSGLGAVVNVGTLVLAKASSHSPDVHAVGGNGPIFGVIVNGGTLQLAGTGGDQIFDGGGVTVASGTLDTNGRNETIDTLHLQGTGIGGAGAVVNTATGASVLTIQTTAQVGTTLTGDAAIGVPQAAGSLTINGTFGGSFTLTKTGAGNLVLNGPSSPSTSLQVNAGQILLNGSNWGNTTINGSVSGVQTLAANVFSSSARVTLNGTASGGFVGLNGFNQSIGSLAGTGGQLYLTGPQTNATLTVGTDNTSTTFAGAILGPGAVVKVGSGTLTLVGSNFTNSFTNLTINGGTVQTANDNTLGVGGVTIGPFGTLTFTASTSAGRTITMNGGTLAVPGGVVLTLNNAAVGGGFLHGPGTFAVTGGTTLAGDTSSANAVINQTGAGSFVNFSNGGSLTVAAGAATPSNFSTFTNQGSGAIAVAASGQVNAADFQSYGTLTLAPGVTGATTRLTNAGTTPLYFNGGSRTFIGTPPTAGQNLALLDLHGQNAVVAGGLFVNNGFVGDSTGNGATIIADYGALVKGAGTFQSAVITQNGGKFQAGNSPGISRAESLILGPGGTSSFNWQINNATGAAGPTPDANNQVSGWSLLSVEKLVDPFTGQLSSGDLNWTATGVAGTQFNMSLQTLIDPITVGQDTQGAMANFDNKQQYAWKFVSWQGTYTGPTDDAALSNTVLFDASNFVNPLDPAGKFSLHYNGAAKEIDVVYAVPEPGTLALVGVAAIGLLVRCRSKRRS
jgi:fibronectin-binding autotransporter adhesin